MSPEKTVAVIGVGNVLMGDEGLGVHALEPLAQHLAEFGGRVALVGIPRLDRISYEPHKARRKELDVFNIRRSRFTVEAGLAMAKAKQVDLRTMVTHRLPLEEIRTAFELVESYADGVVKAVIRVSDG